MHPLFEITVLLLTAKPIGGTSTFGLVDHHKDGTMFLSRSDDDSNNKKNGFLFLEILVSLDKGTPLLCREVSFTKSPRPWSTILLRKPHSSSSMIKIFAKKRTRK